MEKARVLVVEDEEGIRSFIARVLESDFEVHLAVDGQEGLSRAHALKPALILLDLRMPGIDGLTVLAKLKGNRATSAIPVVIVSGQGDTEMLLEGQRAGAVDHIIKPFDAEGLRKVVQRQVSIRGHS